MTSPISLPGNGYSVWTNRVLPVVSLTLVDPAVIANLTLVSSASTADGPTLDTAAPQAPPRKRSGSLLRWAAALLIGSTLAAFLAEKSKNKDLMTNVVNLTDANGMLTTEKSTFHDNWKLEEVKNAGLSEDIAGLEKNLADSKANVMQLTAEKNGLSKTIDELRNVLAMTVEEMKNTEASLTKIINNLEEKNASITSALATESANLKEVKAKLAAVTDQLNEAKQSNETLTAQNNGLKDKVSQLQSSLDQTIKDAEVRENTMREQMASLEMSNQELASSLEAQKKELSEVKSKLKASEEEAVAADKDGDTSQSQLKELSSKLEEAVAARDVLETEKLALASSIGELNDRLEHQKTSVNPDTQALQEELDALKASDADSATQIKTLEANRDELLHRNADLQSAVEKLNGDLSSLAEKEDSEEVRLTARIKELTENNEALKQSLETQRSEFKALLKQAATPTDESSTVKQHEELSGAVKDLKNTLGQALDHNRETNGRLQDKNEDLSNMLVAHTSEILDLNTRIFQVDEEISAAETVLGELESLRQQVKDLRSEGASLENELAQRVTHISTLNDSNTSWQQETLKLRSLLEAESKAQAKLTAFVSALQERIGDLETAPAEVATAQ